MSWTEIMIKIPLSGLSTATAIAQMATPYGIYIEDYSRLEDDTREIAHIDLIDEELLQKDKTIGIIHLYISPDENPSEAAEFLCERLRAENIPFECSTERINTEDWAENWKKYFKPLPVGEKLLICPSWEPYYEFTDRIFLNIDPGMAFGTGTHSSTRLCLEMLEKYVTPDTEMLDIGCGSGILSIAACLLGAKSVTGVDIDPMAVKTAKENGRINKLTEPSYQMREGNLTDTVSGKHHIITANIVADVIVSLCENIEPYLTEKGIWIMSGIIDIREDDVKKALKWHGFEIIEKREEKGWVALAVQKSEKKVRNLRFEKRG